MGPLAADVGMDERARPERARHHAVAAADAAVLVDEDDAVVAAEGGACRADVDTRRRFAVLAHHRHRRRRPGPRVLDGDRPDPLGAGGVLVPPADYHRRTRELCTEHDIKYEDVERVEAVVNWMETQYPSPAFPSRREDGEARAGGTKYYTAYGVAMRGFPLLRNQGMGSSDGIGDPPEVLDLMHRVTIIPSHQMTLFGPRITVFTKDGKSYTKQSTGREFMWDFEEEARRIREVIPGLPVTESRFEEIIATCSGLDNEEQADKLVKLTTTHG